MRIGILLEDDRRLQETMRVGRDLEQRVAELHGLSEAAVAITSSLRLDEMLQVISDQARVLIGANVSGAALVSPEGGVLDLVAYSFTQKQAAFATYKTDQPITGAGIHNWIMKNRTNVRLTQAQLESHRAFERFGPGGGKHPPLRGLLAVPLIARNGEALGFIQVSDRYEGDFTEHDEQLLAHFGRLAAVAVENGRLHQRVRQAEGRVHNQAELLKAVTDSTAEAILGLDDAWRISFANQVAQTLLGAPGAGLVGHCLHDIIQCEQEEADCRSGHCMSCRYCTPAVRNWRGKPFLPGGMAPIYPFLIRLRPLSDTERSRAQ
jgi:GAF domain-containing protein